MHSDCLQKDIKRIFSALLMAILLTGGMSFPALAGGNIPQGHWEEGTKEIFHEEKGHYESVAVGTETVVDEEAWTEKEYDTFCICSECGYETTSGDDIERHVVLDHNNDASWGVVERVVNTIEHPAVTHEEPVYEDQWVVDEKEWYEQVPTGEKYCVLEDGTRAADTLVRIDGDIYYFDSNGSMATGWVRVGNTWYYMNSEGVAQTGWQDIDGKRYYLDENGEMQTGRQTIGGEEYLFEDSGALHTEHRWDKAYTVDRAATPTETGSESIHCSVCNAVKEGSEREIPVLTGRWKEDRIGWWYCWSDGSFPKGVFLDINGKTYSFDDSGYMVTGWENVDGSWYYFDRNGAMVTNRWIGNYYLTENGEMAVSRWIGAYYVGEDGEWIPGYKEAD